MLTPQHKLGFSMIAAASSFWVPVAVLYHQDRGATLEQILSMIAFHYFCIVLLEYPTGVIGDYMGYKKSVIAGYTFMAIGFFMLSIPAEMPLYFFASFLTAVGRTFSSGSDVAWYHSLSADFKKEYSKIRFYSTIAAGLSMVIGGLIAEVKLVIPYLLTAIINIVAILLLFTVPSTHTRASQESANIFQHAAKGLQYGLRHSHLFIISILGMFVIGFFFSVKWLYNPVFEFLTIDVKYWGIIIGSFGFIRAFGVHIAKYIRLLYPVLLIPILTAYVGTLSNMYLVLAAFVLLHILFGIAETTLTVKVNEFTTDSIRASVNSLQTLLQRLFSSAYLFIIGHATTVFGLSWIFYATAAALAIVSVGAFFIRSPRHSLRLAKDILL